jgi:small nuclear ribonucleoprotein (snRNP)-like protein
MDKRLLVHLQGGRKVSGVLRGYDLFLNLVVDDALEETTPAQKHPIGTVVSNKHISMHLQLTPFTVMLFRSFAVIA